MVMLFSLKPQRDNRQNALAVSPAKEKAGKKAVFSPHCGDETTTCYNRALENHRKGERLSSGVVFLGSTIGYDRPISTAW